MAFGLRQIGSNSGGNTSGITVTFNTGATIAGSVVLVAGMFDATHASAVTISDVNGDSVQDSGKGVIVNGFTGINIGTYIKGIFSLSAPITAVTATFTLVGGTNPVVYDMALWEITGGTSVTFDKVNQASATNTNADSGSTGTLSSATEFGIGYGVSDSSFTTQGSGWTLDSIVAGTGSLQEHQIISSTTPIDGTGTQSGNNIYSMWVATIMNGGGGGGFQPSNPYINQPQLASILAQKRKSVGWTPHYDHRFRPQRGLLVPNRKLILPKKAA